MALQKEIQSKFGVVGNYLRITQIDIKAASNILDIRVDVYKDKAARDAKKAPLEQKFASVRGASFIAMAGSATNGGSFFNEIATACYNHLKALPAFADSVDV